jgi:hypothetical protein
MIATEWLYWIAGLLEGEGCFQHRRNGDLLVQVVMTDGDIIGRLQTLLGFGTLRQSRLPSGKTGFRWTSTHQANTAGLLMTVLPLMGARRADKIRECLKAWGAKPLRKAMWTHCKNGHELSGDNLWLIHEGKYEKRRCRECARLRQIKYKQSKRPETA